jgi:hypothetical protein
MTLLAYSLTWASKHRGHIIFLAFSKLLLSEMRAEAVLNLTKPEVFEIRDQLHTFSHHFSE